MAIKSSAAKHGDGWRSHAAQSAGINYAMSVVKVSTGKSGIIDIYKYYDDLTTQKERDLFLDTLTQHLGMSEVSWAQLYTALSLVKDHPEYLKKRGYNTFEAFLQERLSGALMQWRKLESLYHYAKIACPELFEVSDAEMASMKAVVHAAISAPSRSARKNTDDTEENYRVSKNNMMLEYRGAVQMLTSGHGEHSLTRVIKQASKVKPEIIPEILRQLEAGEIKQGPNDAGKFIARDQYGHMRWVVSEIERAIGKKTNPERAAELSISPPSIASAKRMIDKMQLVEDRKERDELFKYLLNTQTWIGKRIKRYAER